MNAKTSSPVIYLELREAIMFIACATSTWMWQYREGGQNTHLAALSQRAAELTWTHPQKKQKNRMSGSTLLWPPPHPHQTQEHDYTLHINITTTRARLLIQICTHQPHFVRNSIRCLKPPLHNFFRLSSKTAPAITCHVQNHNNCSQV